MELYTIGQAATYLGVSQMTLRRWEAEGKLVPVYRTKGNHRKYSLEQLHDFKKENGKVSETIQNYVIQNKNKLFYSICQLAHSLVIIRERLRLKKMKSLPVNWEKATNFLFQYSHESKSELIFPTNFADQLNLIKTPLYEWPIAGMKELFQHEAEATTFKPVLYEEESFLYAHVLQEQFLTSDKTEKFKNFMMECRKQGENEFYTEVRKFLIQNPVLAFEFRSEATMEYNRLKTKLKDFAVASDLFDVMYEPVPKNKIEFSNTIYRCPYCKGALQIVYTKNGKQFRCEFLKCKHYSDQKNSLVWRKPQEQSYSNPPMQLTKEALHSITIPGISEIRILEKLAKLSQVENLQLFPECDIGDISFELNGELYLIDVKDYLSALSLSYDLNKDVSYRIPRKKYDHQIIVVPEFRNINYVRIVKRKLHQDFAYDVLHENELLKLCKQGGFNASKV
ncbi:MerR family transcriptional regulator [Lysinibacillus yapensis]|uniref:MerR family transcriptional regulator n=1 Tax=Ureibacillus yapensis TaxID=2304605 RepID=A0A396SCM3_9BACL|nr:MerR family transcriptional regulator [Lysinibacillus yapensis]RHW37457.1 MerR family transcriptional regulator [Lysinibacillus yapensis]